MTRYIAQISYNEKNANKDCLNKARSVVETRLAGRWSRRREMFGTKDCRIVCLCEGTYTQLWYVAMLVPREAHLP